MGFRYESCGKIPNFLKNYLQQGLGSSFYYMARDYYFKDVKKLQPATAQIFSAVAQTPWNLKPLYGILSDSVLIYGYHRVPYIFIAGIIGAVSLALLSILPVSAVISVILMFFISLSVASPDVMIDGVVAEKAKACPKYGTDLQSLCYGSQSLCAIIGLLTSGLVIREFGSRVIFGVLVFGSIGVALPAFGNWLGEKKDLKSYHVGCCARVTGDIIRVSYSISAKNQMNMSTSISLYKN